MYRFPRTMGAGSVVVGTRAAFDAVLAERGVAFS